MEHIPNSYDNNETLIPKRSPTMKNTFARLILSASLLCLISYANDKKQVENYIPAGPAINYATSLQGAGKKQFLVRYDDKTHVPNMMSEGKIYDYRVAFPANVKK